MNSLQPSGSVSFGSQVSLIPLVTDHFGPHTSPWDSNIFSHNRTMTFPPRQHPEWPVSLPRASSKQVALSNWEPEMTRHIRGNISDRGSRGRVTWLLGPPSLEWGHHTSHRAPVIVPRWGGFQPIQALFSIPLGVNAHADAHTRPAGSVCVWKN